MPRSVRSHCALHPTHSCRSPRKTPLLAAGESCTVQIAITNDDLAIFDEAKSAWVLPAGDYRLSLGFSSADLKQYKEMFIPATTVVRKVTDVLKPADGKLYIE